MRPGHVEHEYGECQLVFCPLCRAHEGGYLEGKTAAHEEVRLWELGHHEDDCECRPCETVRLLLGKFEDAVRGYSEPSLLPAGHLDGCQGPRRCAVSCSCFCHALERRRLIGS